MPHIIEVFDPRRHDPSSFSCGNSTLDAYIRKRAHQDLKRRAAAVFVATLDDSRAMAGYHTLSSLSVALEDLPEATARRMPRYPLVPVTLLGRLAVDGRHRGQRLGELLLVDSLSRALRTSTDVASFAVVVDAIDDKARGFYEHYEFIPFPDQPRRLFLPMASIAAILS